MLVSFSSYCPEFIKQSILPIRYFITGPIEKVKMIAYPLFQKFADRAGGLSRRKNEANLKVFAFACCIGVVALLARAIFFGKSSSLSRNQSDLESQNSYSAYSSPKKKNSV